MEHDTEPPPCTPPPPIGPPIEGTPAYRIGVPPVVLQYTSQGRKRDIPPEEWQLEELRRYGVVGVKNVRQSDLTVTPHPIFARERFPGMDKERFDAMHQSTRLASILLEIGLPYLASFLPESNFRKGVNPKSVPGQPMEVIDILKTISKSHLEEVRNELNEIAKTFEWHEDPQIFQRKGWWGITSSSFPKTVKNFGTQQIIASSRQDWKLKMQGFKRRMCTVGFCSEYVDTLMKTGEADEQHLCAAFHLAVTLVHELGHVVFWQNLGNRPAATMGFEPSIDGQPIEELGLAFTGWLFGGWNPEPIRDDESDEVLFGQGMFWQKQLSSTIRPNWKIYYSMPLEFIQRLMTQSTWDEWMGNLNHPTARELILPIVPFRYGQDARKAECEKYKVAGIWNWKSGQKLNSRFDTNIDDDEDFGDMPEGYPPFGFDDENWTAGPEAENYGEGFRPPLPPRAKVTPTKRNPFQASINVTYAGIYHEDTQTFEKVSKDGSDGQAGSQPVLDLGQYLSWTEGVLRSLCLSRDLSGIGEKGELATRLIRYDQLNGQKTPEATGNKALEPDLSFRLEWFVKVRDFKQQLSERTGMPVELQYLVFANGDHAKEDSDQDVLGNWRYLGGVERMSLWRIQRANNPDPGPLLPPIDPHAQKPSSSPRPHHINIFDNPSDAPTPPPRRPVSPNTVAAAAEGAAEAAAAAMAAAESMPAYIARLGKLPDPRLVGPPTDNPHAPWADKAAGYRRMQEEVEAANHTRRQEFASWMSEAEQVAEHVEYVQLLIQIRLALEERNRNKGKVPDVHVSSDDDHDDDGMEEEFNEENYFDDLLGF